MKYSSPGFNRFQLEDTLCFVYLPLAIIKRRINIFLYHIIWIFLKPATNQKQFIVLSGRNCLTDSFADAGCRIHLVAVVTFALVSALQVDADLTADAGIQTLIDVCTRRETEDEDEGENRGNTLKLTHSVITSTAFMQRKIYWTLKRPRGVVLSWLPHIKKCWVLLRTGAFLCGERMFSVWVLRLPHSPMKCSGGSIADSKWPLGVWMGIVFFSPAIDWRPIQGLLRIDWRISGFVEDNMPEMLIGGNCEPTVIACHHRSLATSCSP